MAFDRRFTTSELKKANSYTLLPGKGLRTLVWSSDLLAITLPLTKPHFSTSLATYWSRNTLTTPLPFSFQADQKDNLIEKDIEKEWETVWEAFPEFLDNFREATRTPLASPCNTHTSTSSTIHYSTSLLILPHLLDSSLNCHLHQYNLLQQHPKISSNHPSNHPHNHLDHQHLHIYNSHLPQTTTIRKKPSSIKKSAPIVIPKGHLPTLDILPSRDIQLKRYKKYFLPLKQPQTSLTAAPISNSKSSTSISTTTATKSTQVEDITSNRHHYHHINQNTFSNEHQH